MTIARRLRLPSDIDQWSRPWRYWLLRYLAALAEVADYEGTTFGREEARAALETLRDDVVDVLKLLRGKERQR